MSVVLTVKVEGLIEPSLAQMASTKACYKLGLTVSQNRICVSLSIYFWHLLHFSFILFCLLHNDCFDISFQNLM